MPSMRHRFTGCPRTAPLVAAVLVLVSLRRIGLQRPPPKLPPSRAGRSPGRAPSDGLAALFAASPPIWSTFERTNRAELTN